MKVKDRISGRDGGAEMEKEDKLRDGGKEYNGRDERWEGKAITCTRETVGRGNDIKGREDLYDRSHYNGDGGRV